MHSIINVVYRKLIPLIQKLSLSKMKTPDIIKICVKIWKEIEEKIGP